MELSRCVPQPLWRVQAQKALKLKQWQQGWAPSVWRWPRRCPGRLFQQRICGQAQGLPPLWSPGCCSGAFRAGQSWPPILLLQPGSPNLLWAFRALEPRVRGPPVLSCAGAVSVLRDTWDGPLGPQWCFFPLLRQGPMSWLDGVNSKVPRQGLCQPSFQWERFHRRQDSGHRLL